MGRRAEGEMISNDTISTENKKEDRKKGEDGANRSVRTLKPWDYQIPYRFVSSRPETAETLIVVLRGRVGLLMFPASGKLVQTVRLGGKGEKREYRVPGGTHFTVITLVSESAILEAQPSAVGVRVEWLPDMPVAHTEPARQLWRRWFDYFQRFNQTQNEYASASIRKK